MTGGPDADGRASLVAVVLCLLIRAIFSTIG